MDARSRYYDVLLKKDQLNVEILKFEIVKLFPFNFPSNGFEEFPIGLKGFKEEQSISFIIS